MGIKRAEVKKRGQRNKKDLVTVKCQPSFPSRLFFPSSLSFLFISSFSLPLKGKNIPVIVFVPFYFLPKKKETQTQEVSLRKCWNETREKHLRRSRKEERRKRKERRRKWLDLKCQPQNNK